MADLGRPQRCTKEVGFEQEVKADTQTPLDVLLDMYLVRHAEELKGHLDTRDMAMPKVSRLGKKP